MKICAVVVTFNRLELLKLTIEKLKSQTRALDEIIIVNNASTDGTKEYLDRMNDDTIISFNLDKNIGGAGGFNYGIKLAYEREADLVWIMDDDTIATEDALLNLINGLKNLKNKKIDVGFVASNVLFKDNKPCLMNIPKVSEQWNELAGENLIKLDHTSFVSVLITREAIKTVGLPISEFFIWGDDVEYTSRIVKDFEGYMVTDSIVHHYMNENSRIDIIKTEPERIGRYFYEYRNTYYINKKQGMLSLMKFYLYVIKSLIKVVIKNNTGKLKKISIIIKGVIAGIKFNPKIEDIQF